MHRETVTADENTSIETVIETLRARLQRNGVSPQTIDALCSQTNELLSSLIKNGKVLAAQGSQLKVTRELSVDGHNIKLIFGAGAPRPGWRKFLDRLVGS